MKIVSFGDVHMETFQIERIKLELKSADVTIISGDLTNFGGITEAKEVIDATRKYCSDIRVIPGNLDLLEIIPFLDKQGLSLHGKNTRYGDVTLYGCGGSNLTPFLTPIEFADEVIWQTLEQALPPQPRETTHVMVCHTPPYATKVDRLRSGVPVGSPAVRQFLSDHQPAVCITAHIHESAGVDHIGQTKILNAGPFREGGYIVVESKGRKVDAELRIA